MSDFKTTSKDGLEIQYATLILNKADRSQKKVPVAGVGSTAFNDAAALQLVSEDHKVAIQVITLENGNLIANFISEDDKIDLQGSNAMTCKDYRR